MLFSICIPSYNRGHRAEALVRRLLTLPYGKDQIEIVLSNNGSVKNTEGYEALKAIRDERFHYFEFESNQQFVGNLNQVIKMASGDFCMPISDEDDIVADNLVEYMAFLEKHPNIGIMRSATTFMYGDEENCYSLAGEQAIDSFYMRGNYISGVIYNRSIVTNALIDDYAARYCNNVAYTHYPHMFLDAYVLTKGDFCGCSSLLILEGQEEGDMEYVESAEIAVYSTYQNRLEQYQGYVEQICDMEVPDGIKLQMYLLACDKTHYLLDMIKPKYIQNGYDYHQIMLEMSANMKTCLDALGLALYPEEKKLVLEYIDSIAV